MAKQTIEDLEAEISILQDGLYDLAESHTLALEQIIQIQDKIGLQTLHTNLFNLIDLIDKRISG